MRPSFIWLLVNMIHVTSGIIYPIMAKVNVSVLLNKKDTQAFIMGFNNSYQRWIITQQLKFCPYEHQCGFTFGLDKPYIGMESLTCCIQCDCDFPSCLLRHICCPDVLFRHIPVGENTTISKTELEHFTGRGLPKTCILLTFGSIRVDTSIESAFAYASCPLSSDEDLAHNCSRKYSAHNLGDIYDMTPVQMKTSNELYRNKYCAFCNNIVDDEFKYLNIEVFCLAEVGQKRAEDILDLLFTKRSCDIAFTADGDIDDCKFQTISECNRTGKWMVYNSYVEKACGLFISPVEVDFKIFQNVFCAICNGVVDKIKQHCSERIFGSDAYGDFSFSGLLKLSSKMSMKYRSKPDQLCTVDQFYDTITKKCKDIFCSPIMTVSSGNCTDTYEKIKETTYNMYLRIKPLQQMSVREAYDMTDRILDDVISNYVFGERELRSLQVILQSNTPSAGDSKVTSESGLLYFEIRMKYDYLKYHDPYYITEETYNLTKALFRSQNITFETNVFDCDPYRRYRFDIVEFISDPLYSYPYRIKALPLSVLLDKYTAPGNEGLSMIAYPFYVTAKMSKKEGNRPLNIIWIKSCPQINISRFDLDWVLLADGVLIQYVNLYIDNADFYYIDDDHIAICVDTFRGFMSRVPSLDNVFFSAETIVSIGCSTLSIICLLITISAFAILPELRQTLPGKNNFSLVICLLCAQSLYLVKGLARVDTDSILCNLIGISLHFIWLVTLFWMNNCTFHMFRALTRVKIISQDTGSKPFVLYHIYALVMSAIFVGINIIVSLQVSGHIGYGGNVCYISSQEMINFTFLVPTSSIVVANISMFLVVVVKISKISSIQKNVQNERSDLLVFTKLSTITGATWIFGLLYSLTHLTIFSYLFILLNAFQGVFIMLAFIVNKRVLDLLKSKFTLTST